MVIGESNEFNASQRHYQSGIGSLLEAEQPTRPDYDEDDEKHFVRSVNFAPSTVDIQTEFDTMFEQSMADATETVAKQADFAITIRQAADLKTVAEVAKNPADAEKIAVDFLKGLREKLPTGEIEIQTITDEERLGMTAIALVKMSQQLGEPKNVDALADENDKLRGKLKAVLPMLKLDQVQASEVITTHEATIAAQKLEIAALHIEITKAHAALESEQLKVADRDRIIYGQPMETMRKTLLRAKIFGAGVMGRLSIAE